MKCLSNPVVHRVCTKQHSHLRQRRRAADVANQQRWEKQSLGRRRGCQRKKRTFRQSSMIVLKRCRCIELTDRTYTALAQRFFLSKRWFVIRNMCLGDDDFAMVTAARRGRSGLSRTIFVRMLVMVPVRSDSRGEPVGRQQQDHNELLHKHLKRGFRQK